MAVLLRVHDCKVKGRLTRKAALLFMQENLTAITGQSLGNADKAGKLTRFQAITKVIVHTKGVATYRDTGKRGRPSLKFCRTVVFRSVVNILTIAPNGPRNFLRIPIVLNLDINGTR